MIVVLCSAIKLMFSEKATKIVPCRLALVILLRYVLHLCINCHKQGRTYVLCNMYGK